MKVSAVIVNHRKAKKNNISLNLSLILSILPILCGFISGALLYAFMKENLYRGVFDVFISFFTDFSNKSSLEILSGLIISELPYIFIMLIFSFSAIGYPFVLMLTYIKSIAPTLLFAHLYSEYALKGAEYVFLILLPGEIINLFGIILLTQGCFAFSRHIDGVLKNLKGEYIQELKGFLLKFSVSVAIILFGNLITLFTISLFSGLFSF